MSGTSRSLPVGDRVGGYQIMGLVGAGGMGVVYKALDLKLERTVALKFLPHDLNIEERDKERFLREAKAASALDHTNIGVIHGLEESEDGRLFIVMAYYEGETLSQLIKRGPLPPAEAVDIAIQIARGLAEAHGRQIVHRDIKPSNVIRTAQNVAKIVDFGLARVVTSASATQSLGTTGTLAYMSPEQAAGKPVDQRTDIWALGVTLAEMLTGRNPFWRDDAHGVLFAILNQPPAAMEEVPLELQQIIYRALAKEPAKRYQDCHEMLADLEKARAGLTERTKANTVDDLAPTQSIRPKDFEKYVEHASSPTWGPAVAARPRGRWWIAAGSVVLLIALAALALPSARERIGGLLFASEEKHIAVLPFDNIGNNPANAAVAEGLMDSLSSRLSNLEVGKQSLWVVPASVVRSRKVDDPTAALRVLGATLVVKGSIQRDGQDVHLTVNLINAKTMRQIGSVALEDRTGDIATLQDETVARLSKLMGIVVTPEMLKATGGRVNPVAYESYLKALGYIQRWDKPGNLDSAISELNDAVKTDPQFALGFAELGEAYRLKYTLDRNPRSLEEISANCQRATQLDDRLPAVYVTLGRMHSWLGKADLALQEFTQALKLNPRDPDALMGMAGAYERMGRIPEAEGTFKRAAALRPDYWDGYNSLGLFYIRQKRLNEAIAQFRHVIELTPDNATAYNNLATAYMEMGDPKVLPQAAEALEKSVQLSPSYPAYANLGSLYISTKQYAKSAATTEKALQLNDKDFRVWANLALAYQWLQNSAKVREATERERVLLEDYVKQHPTDAFGQSALGVLYAEDKQRDRAITRLDAALALTPKDPRILADAAEMWEDLGDRQRALHYAEESLKNGSTLDDLRDRFTLQGVLADPKFKPNAK
jgi:serine/threonine protein kinase/tetratricopeptide (TPR) repeat protein